MFALALSDSQIASVRRDEPSQTLVEHELSLVETPNLSPDVDGEFSAWDPGVLLASATSYTVVADTAELKFKTGANEPALVRTGCALA